MKILLSMVLLLLMAGSAFAQLDNSMGLFFSDTELSEEMTNADPVVSAPFNAYIALLMPTQETVGGYECMLTADPNLLALAVTGPNGWTNFGGNFNHLAGYGTPIPSTDDVVLCTFQFLYLVATPSDIVMGPSDPSSVGGAGPAIADGENPDILITCNYTSGPDAGGLVATLYGDGITFPPSVATQNASWSGVKSLFE